MEETERVAQTGECWEGAVSADDVERALRRHILDRSSGYVAFVPEMVIPLLAARADLVAVSRESMDGYEIKTERDTLRRLVRQVRAYESLFDHCTVVCAGKHLGGLDGVLPVHWGIIVIRDLGSEIQLLRWRPPQPHPPVHASALIRCLWREEMLHAVRVLGGQPRPSSSAGELRTWLREHASVDELRTIVRWSLTYRDPNKAAFPSRRYEEARAAGTRPTMIPLGEALAEAMGERVPLLAPGAGS